MDNENTDRDNNSEMEKPEPISLTAKNLREILDSGRKLVILILQHDPDVERAFKFQQDIDQCLAPYEKLHAVLSRKQSLITDFITKTSRPEIFKEIVSETATDTVKEIVPIEVTVEPDMTLMLSSDDSDC